MVVQSFGMALVITPLTTAALGSVEREHSGLASGVNNAVTRVAGLLAVAVLGVVVHGAFSANLDTRLERVDLPGGVRMEMEAAKAELGAAEARGRPGSIAPTTLRPMPRRPTRCVGADALECRLGLPTDRHLIRQARSSYESRGLR
jgi:hypothetical protein